MGRSSPEELLPWVLGDDQLGDAVIELGAGPGLVTDLLLDRAGHVTAVEIDEELAGALRRRLAGRSVEVITADATALPLPDNRFSAAACFTMLHHIPGPRLQDRALAEIARVLRPGGLLLGTDGRDTPSRRALHVGDVFEPNRSGESGRPAEHRGFRRAGRAKQRRPLPLPRPSGLRRTQLRPGAEISDQVRPCSRRRRGHRRRAW